MGEWGPREQVSSMNVGVGVATHQPMLHFLHVIQ